MESANFLKRVPRGNGVHEQEALACAHVLLPHGPILFLSSSVENIQKRNLVVNNALLPVRVFNRRVVLVDEVALDELDSET